jgi:hypothetical protein
MRYLYLAFAALSTSAFLALHIPQPRIRVDLLSSIIEIPVSSLANLSFVLGIVAGVGLALFILSFVGTRDHARSASPSSTRAGA